MKFCKPHNRNFSDDRVVCPKCETRVVEEASRLPYRVTNPQAHDRCHDCWNLLPVCRCDLSGSIALPDLPNLYA